jgi:hypothetical protein
VYRTYTEETGLFTVTIPAQHTPFPQLQSAETRTTPGTDNLRCILFYPSLWSLPLVKGCTLLIETGFFICRDASAAAGKEPAAHPRGAGQQQQRFHHQVGILWRQISISILAPDLLKSAKFGVNKASNSV